MAKKKVPITRARASSSGGQSAVVSTVDWLKYLIITVIPILGLVMCFVWAFGRGNLNRRNLFRAVLILMAIGIVLGIIFGSVTQSIFGPLFDVFRGI